MIERVTTKAQLKKAQKNKVDTIIVAGELAASMFKAKKVARLSKATIAVVAATLAATPFTGGLSLAAAAPIAAIAGVEASVIVAVVAVGGLALVLAICKDYSIRVTKKDGNGNVTEIELTKK